MEESTISKSTEFVLVPRKEYDELITARMGINMISSTIGHYGADDKVVIAVCKQFGYEFKEETPDA